MGDPKDFLAVVDARGKYAGNSFFVFPTVFFCIFLLILFQQMAKFHGQVSRSEPVLHLRCRLEHGPKIPQPEMPVRSAWVIESFWHVRGAPQLPIAWKIITYWAGWPVHLRSCPPRNDCHTLKFLQSKRAETEWEGEAWTMLCAKDVARDSYFPPDSSCYKVAMWCCMAQAQLVSLVRSLVRQHVWSTLPQIVRCPVVSFWPPAHLLSSPIATVFPGAPTLSPSLFCSLCGHLSAADRIQDILELKQIF